MRSTTEVFEDHLGKRLRRETEDDVTTNYAEDVVILCGKGVFRGHDGVRASAHDLHRRLGSSQYQYNHTLVEGEYAFLEWSAEGDHTEVCDGADAFVIRNGEIVCQMIHYSVRTGTDAH